MRRMLGCRIAMAVGLAMVCGRAMAQGIDARVQGTELAAWRLSKMPSQGGKVLLVTMASPEKKQSCRVAAFDADKIECAKHGKKTIAYRRSEIIAIITPGVDSHLRWFVMGFLGGSGAVFWGAVVLAPVCIPCTVGLSVVGTIMFTVTGAMAVGDNSDSSEHAIYVKEGETLRVKLR